VTPYATFAPEFNPDGPEIAEKLMTTRAAHKMSAEGAIMGRDANMLLLGDKDPGGEGADEGGPATGGGASSNGGGAGDSVSDGAGGGAAADKDMPNHTKDEIDTSTREITENERTVAAAASIVDEKRYRLQLLQRELAQSKPLELLEARFERVSSRLPRRAVNITKNSGLCASAGARSGK
jgi:hypothetical protein